MLFDPAKSAEPPIKLLATLVNAFKVSSEDFLVAKLLSSLIVFCFSVFKIFVKLFFSKLFILLFSFYKSCSKHSQVFDLFYQFFSTHLKFYLEFQKVYNSNLEHFLQV